MSKTKIIALVAALLAASPVWAGVSARVTENLDWQLPFAGAASWGVYGVSDNNTAAQNDAALATIPGGVPVIGDCLHGGQINVSGSWAWPSNLLMWQKAGCGFVTTNIDPAVYSVQTPANLLATSPTTNVKYYGFQFRCLTPTQGVRTGRWWINGLVFMHADIEACGGIVPRGGNSYLAFNHIDTYPLSVAGNPGIRHLGVDPGVPLSPGMAASYWARYNYIRSGDSAFQICQPAASPIGSWQYATLGTDGALYQSSYGVASILALINLQNAASPFYPCKNITYDQVDGSGIILANIIPGVLGVTSTENVLWSGSNFLKTGSGTHAALGIGNVSQGAAPPFIGTELYNFRGTKININDAFRQAVDVEGCFNGQITIDHSTFGGRATNIFSSPEVEFNKTCGVKFNNNSVDVSGGGDAVRIGNTGASSRDALSSVTVTGIRDGSTGINFVNAANESLTSSTISATSGSTTSVGVSMVGADTTTVTGNPISAPVPVVCRSGHGNIVTGNPGAPDCP